MADPHLEPRTERASFQGHGGHRLDARLELPAGPMRAMALFAHCFTCGKDLRAARAIATELARAGIGVMRFDFTGLGSSEGEFENTDFSSNLEDLRRAAAWLREHHRAPDLLIGHSLGGAAVLAVAADIEEVRAVATIGAPGTADHVLHNFEAHLDEIESEGRAQVKLAGRSFTVARSFVEDLRSVSLADRVKAMRRPLLVLHSPVDQTVGIDNATTLFTAARHPKSFVSLDDADHLLSREADAAYAARVVVGWADRYLPTDAAQGADDAANEHVTVAETGASKFQQTVHAGRHRFFADEPESYGGTDTGPSPYDLVAAGLGACTAMTLRMYADHKGFAMGRVSVDVAHAKVHAKDCAECSEETRDGGGRLDRFERTIAVEGGPPDGMADKLLEIADKCPVHRTLERTSVVATKLASR